MRLRIIHHFILFVLIVFTWKVSANSYPIKEISLLSVNSAITPATFDYLDKNIRQFPKHSLVVLKLNTPGGLVSTTKDIITLIGREQRPLVVWITPEGASAASAGAIIASAAHFIFMSPGTNMGAATPIGMGGDIKESDGRSKAINDLKALVRSLSISRGRPSLPFEKMITDADSLTTLEAEKAGILSGVISHQHEIQEKLVSKKFLLDGKETELVFENPVFKEYSPSLGQNILEVIANPSTAYILFLLGIALIYFELQAPGGFIAGSIGVCCLILCGIAFQVLPLHWGAIGLIAAGIFLLILEIYITSYGILSIAGLAAFTAGSLFLFQGDTGFISVQYPAIISTLAGVVVAIGILVWYLMREEKRTAKVSDFFLPVGSKGTVLSKSNNEYQVKVKGEIWRATSEEELSLNDSIDVESVDSKKLYLKIKKSNA